MESPQECHPRATREMAMATSVHQIHWNAREMVISWCLNDGYNLVSRFLKCFFLMILYLHIYNSTQRSIYNFSFLRICHSLHFPGTIQMYKSTQISRRPLVCRSCRLPSRRKVNGSIFLVPQYHFNASSFLILNRLSCIIYILVFHVSWKSSSPRHDTNVPIHTDRPQAVGVSKFPAAKPSKGERIVLSCS